MLGVFRAVLADYSDMRIESASYPQESSSGWLWGIPKVKIRE